MSLSSMAAYTGLWFNPAIRLSPEVFRVSERPGHHAVGRVVYHSLFASTTAKAAAST